jgi:hypothetical protein
MHNEGPLRGGKKMEKSIFPKPPADPKLQAFQQQTQAISAEAQRKMFGPPKAKPATPEAIEDAKRLARLAERAGEAHRKAGGENNPYSNDHKEDRDEEIH